jgi:hypothetical protein
VSDALPAVHEAVLDAATLEALVADLAAHAEVLGWKVRSRGVVAGGPSSLADAVSGLVGGEVLALQIHYCFGAVEWRDTLLPGPAGVRLVRIQTPPPGGSP